jgi:hypothetical protein
LSRVGHHGEEIREGRFYYFGKKKVAPKIHPEKERKLA